MLMKQQGNKNFAGLIRFMFFGGDSFLSLFFFVTFCEIFSRKRKKTLKPFSRIYHPC